MIREIALHMTQTEKRAIKKLTSMGLSDGRIGRKDYHIRGDKCIIISMKKPNGMIGEKPELVQSIHSI